MKLILSLFFFASIAAAQPDVKLPFTPKQRQLKFIFHRFPDNLKDGDTLVIKRDSFEVKRVKNERTMQRHSHQSAQKVGFRLKDTTTTLDGRVHFRGESDTSDVNLLNVYGDSIPPFKFTIGPMYRLVDTCRPPSDGEVFHRLLSDRSVGVFLALYSRYEKECWDDSTVHEELKPCFSLVNPPCPGHSYNPPRFYVTHRAPTFPGFIEYLRSQK